MISLIRILFFLFLLVFSSVLSQNHFQQSIKCYMIYRHGETKSRNSRILLGHFYHRSEVTQHVTPAGELCSKVGCACFSYRGVCSHSSPGSNHFSECTDTDRTTRQVKWHRGWTSRTNCEEMRQQLHKYPDLTCCYTHRCNNQSEKIITISDIQVPISIDSIYTPQNVQQQSITRRYDNNMFRHTTPRLVDIDESSQGYGKYANHLSLQDSPNTNRSTLTYSKPLSRSHSSLSGYSHS